NNEQIDVENDTDKRQYHNLLERKRRDNLKDTFSTLREAVPSLKGKRNRASRVEILKAATDYLKKNEPKVDIIKDKIKRADQFEEYMKKLTAEIKKCAEKQDWERFNELQKSCKTMKDFGLDSDEDVLVDSEEDEEEEDDDDDEGESDSTESDSSKRLCVNVANE
ncbi:UNVERIFIED_CONTAM: Max, partial [Trichonephila clavipes]